MPYSFSEYLMRRDPRTLYEVLKDLGVDLSDDKTQKAFVTALQQQNTDLKKAASVALANPDSEPDEQQLAADQEFKMQQDYLQGKAVPTGIDKSDWESAVKLVVPKGAPLTPSLIGKGKSPDLIGTLEKGAELGALPQGVEKHMPPGMQMKKITPKVNSKVPQIDPKQMTPSELAKVKSKPGAAGTVR